MFISFEGIEGTGKSTQVHLVGNRLKEDGYGVITTVEPGGTEIGRSIREILLNTNFKEMASLTELLLYNAERVQHLEELIIPALKSGKIILTDRFSDSTIAYQGYGRKIDINILEEIDRIATNCIKPDLTILFDLGVREGLKRNRGMNKLDRLELEDIMFHERVRNGFIELSRKEPERFEVINASKPISDVTDIVFKIIKGRL